MTPMTVLRESDPLELASEVEAAVSQVIFPSIAPTEVVSITISVADRALIVDALRAFRRV